MKGIDDPLLLARISYNSYRQYMWKNDCVSIKDYLHSRREGPRLFSPGKTGRPGHCRRELFAYDLHQHPLFSPPVKFAVENLFPRAEIKFSVRHRNGHLSPHDLPL